MSYLRPGRRGPSIETRALIALPITAGRLLAQLPLWAFGVVVFVAAALFWVAVLSALGWW